MKTDAFEDGGIIPERYAGRGNNVRPRFTFSNIPADTVSFAITFHDVDVAFQRHRRRPPLDRLEYSGQNRRDPGRPLAGRQGVGHGQTSAGETTLDPTRSPAPGTTITSSNYTLNKTLDLPVDATRAQLLEAMDSVVAKAAYVGRFRR